MGQASIGGGGGLEPLIPPTSDRNYLYFQAEEDDCKIWLTAPSSFNVSFQYSTDGTTWNAWNYTGNKTFDKLSMSNRGDYVFIRATSTNTWSASSSNYLKFYSNSSKFRAGGNIMSLYSSALATTNVGQYGFYQLFYGCVYLTGAPELGATTLGNNCYQNMFYGCTGLKTGPSILPATTLPYYCYYQMFYGCSSLIAAPEISATTISSSHVCYNMFYGCASMTTPPSTLPATTLNSNCYQNMFYNCTSLTTAPTLPATTLQQSCYYSMFYGCTSLVTPPTLPATTLANYCYTQMFRGCTSLAIAPDLPATILIFQCYYQMFYNCTSLTTAPALPAETLVNSCYYQMFYGCSHLNYVKSLNKNNNTSWTNNWLYGVSSTGTFVKAAENTGWSRNANGIPSTWNVVDNIDYFSINNTYSGNNTFTLTKTGSPSSSSSIEYSTDSNTWASISWTNSTFTYTIPQNGKIYLRSNSGFSKSSSDYFTINLSNNFTFGGNILTINDYEHIGSATMSSYAFYKLFENCTHLSTPPILPATTLASYCYAYMFKGCTGLTSSPTLPVSTMQIGCYQGMFYGCTSITSPPTLSSTSLASYCYNEMFRGCTGIATAPTLSATTLQSYCYAGMFYGCTSLTKSPTLPVGTLVTGCYNSMFYGCSSLNEITCYATNATSNTYTDNWVYGVAASGTFKSTSGVTWTTGVHGVPTGWTVESSAVLSFSSSTNDFYPTLIIDQYEGYGWEEPYSDKNIDLEYSFDGATWTTVSRQYYQYYNDDGWEPRAYFIFYYQFPQVNVGNTIYIRGNNINNSYMRFEGPYCGFKFTLYDITSCIHSSDIGTHYDPYSEITYYVPSFYNVASDISCGGDITSLLNQVGGDVNLSTIDANSRTFAWLFYNQDIVMAPKLPSTTLGSGCYYGMFCYCNSLTTSPVLPATTLKTECYCQMFYNCDSLTISPTLPATTLDYDCYSYMFYYCGSLNNITVGATSWNTYYANDWVYGVSSSGTFTKPSSTSIPTGENGIPTGWVVNNV